MTLSLRLVLHLTALAVALAILAGVAIVAVRGLNQKLSAALSDYEQLRWCYETGLRIVRVREAMIQESPSDARVLERLAAAVLLIEQPGESHGAASSGGVHKAVLDHLHRAAAAWRAGPARRQAALREVRGAMNTLSAASQDIRRQIHHLDAQAVQARRRAQWMVSGIAVILLLGAVAAGVMQYRTIMQPISRLRTSARRLAAGHWDERVPLVGDQEMAAVAADFNRMAGELEAVYRDLEAKIRDRSRQLARSERLAGVGLLAAGVAHEINNPLAIIAGQAELALRQLGRDGDPDGREAWQTTLDEAFRCKAITQKLLSLSRPAPPCRRPVALNPLIGAAVDAVRGLADQQACRLTTCLDRSDASGVHADEMEVRQVLVNLLLNATAAVTPGEGLIRVTTAIEAGEAVVAVTDNGEGMDDQTLSHVFDPFFTLRGHATGHGHGLGLAVSHAIIISHGGRLDAHSAGLGRGSCFTVRLPLAPPTQQEAS